MKKPIIVANWKSFKNPQEAQKWLANLAILYRLKPFEFMNNIILCAPFLDLPTLKEEIGKLQPELDFVLGAQNIALEEKTPQTGETSPAMLIDLVSFVMIGHSERRTCFNETPEMVNKKIKICVDNGLKIIVCVSNLEDTQKVADEFPDYNELILYEPLSAIGSGQIDNPAKANDMAREIKKIFKNSQVLYGGSVKGENIKLFLQEPEIDGVAIGGASLEPDSFLEILKNASTN